MSIHTTDVLANPFTAYKAVFKFSEVTIPNSNSTFSDYVIYMRSDEILNRRIKEMQFNFVDALTGSNVLGIAASSTARLNIFDIDGTLNINNIESPYHLCLLDGIRVLIYIADTIDSTKNEGADDRWIWQPYGIWYTQNFSSAFYDGGFNDVSVTLQDKINVIGNKSIKIVGNQVLNYGGIGIIELFENVAQNIGMTSSDYVIDSAFTTEGSEYYAGDITYGIIDGTLFNQFLNNICQLLRARAVMRHDGKLYIEPSLIPSTDEHWYIPGQNELRATLTENSRYKDCVVKYYEAKDCDDGIILSTKINIDREEDSEDEYVAKSLVFSRNALSIDYIRAYFDDENSENAQDKLTDISWRGWQSGINIAFKLEESDFHTAGNKVEVKNINLSILGSISDTEEKESNAYAILEKAITSTQKTLYFDSKQIMEEDKANEFASKLADYVSKMIYRKTMSNTVYSPFIQLGDDAVIYGINSEYNGHYRVTGVSINISEGYNLGLTLLKSRDLDEDDEDIIENL